MDKTWKNVTAAVFAFFFCAVAALWSYHNPKAVAQTASSGISAVSIISSLSIALTSILSQKIKIPQNTNGNFIDTKNIEKAVIAENKKISSRQGILMSLSMLAVISGMFLIALDSAYSGGTSAKIASSIYCFTALISFIWSIFVAKALSETTIRNQELEQ